MSRAAITMSEHSVLPPARHTGFQHASPAVRADSQARIRNGLDLAEQDASIGRRLASFSLRQSLAVTAPLALADFAAIWFVLFIATAAAERLLQVPHDLVTKQTALLASLLLLPIAELAGVYPGLGQSPIIEFRQLVRAAMIALGVFAGVGILLFPTFTLYFCFSSLAAFVLAIPVLPAARFTARSVLARTRWWGAPVLIHGEPKMAAELYCRLAQMPDRGFRPAGILLAPHDYWSSGADLADKGIPAFDVRSAAECALARHAAWVLDGSSELTPGLTTSDFATRSLASIPNRVILSSSKLDVGLWDNTYSVGAACGLRVGAIRPYAIKAALKRTLDIAVTLSVLVAGFPLLLAIYFAVRLSSPGQVFYGQERVGRGGKTFTAWKFRSMRQGADRLLAEYLANNPQCGAEWEQTHKLKHDPRVTTIGHFLRSTSLDELPQLWNILVGDMSLVGPRPIVDSPTYDAIYIENYPREFAAYQTMRPGLTGLWQVTCRNNGVYEMRIHWDMYYIRNWSPWLDLYILLRTVRTVLLREGAC